MERKRYIVTISQDYLKNWINGYVKLDYHNAFFENKISYNDVRHLNNHHYGLFWMCNSFLHDFLSSRTAVNLLHNSKNIESWKQVILPLKLID